MIWIDSTDNFENLDIDVVVVINGKEYVVVEIDYGYLPFRKGIAYRYRIIEKDKPPIGIATTNTL